MSDRLRQDLRSAFRQLRLAPGFAAVALITLAFGIGATVAIWSVMRAVVWTPLPYRAPERLVLVWNRLEKTHFGKAPVSAPDFLDYRAQTKSFSALAATNNVFEASLTAEGGEPEQVKVGAVTANFFDALGAPPLLGRTFLKEDETPIPDGAIAPNADPPPGALVISYGFFRRRFGGDPKVIGRTVRFNDAPLTVVGVMPPEFALYMPADAGMPTLVEQLWPGTSLESAIGRRLDVNPFGQPFEVEVAGVVAPVHHMALAAIDRATVYFPLANVPFGPRSYVLRAQAGTDPASLTTAVRTEVARIDPAIPIANVRTLEQAVDQALAPTRFALGLLSLFAALALSLAALGLYGLLAWSVRQRKREIGIRAALGADRGKILGLIVGEGARLALIGIALGLGAALALGRLIASQLHGVAPGDPIVLATVAGLVAGVALWVSWFPALRAAGVDPARAVQGG